ncbi:ankyrin repeat domain-containing protein 10-like isoform X4 [Hemiscyllium ocellatum]|uniref:ankyrin repeat domain-containing protein 10-like isoform X4 n=2 Tax=Hemiscyllium ocellatum TaxID=170820 RepID=UPI002966F107|nr:ankyrin repeat domain-containing protein 10-like isoform X4 [Hemiscyllium ocellatum]
MAAWERERGFSSEELLSLRFPLHRACRDGDSGALRTLLAASSPTDIGVEDNFYGWTPLHWAAHFGKLECVMQLVQAGVGVNIATSRFAQTPAHIAAFGGHPQGLLWLIQAGADYNIQDVVGETPVHKAARSGSLDCLNVLVSHGAKTDLRNANGLTAAELALAQGFQECSQFLCSVQNHQLNGFYTNGIASGLYRDNLITDGLNGYTGTNRKRSHEESERCGIKKPRTDGVYLTTDTDQSNHMDKMLTMQPVTNGSFHSLNYSLAIGGAAELTAGFSNIDGQIPRNKSGFEVNGTIQNTGNTLSEMCGSLHQNGSPSSCVAVKPTLPSCHTIGSLEEDHDSLQYGHYHGFGDTAESIPDINSFMEHSSSVRVEQSYNNAVYSAVHLFHGS